MADSFNRLYAAHPPEVVFDFISDFRHASLWDPRTRCVRQVSDGPIQQGTRFLLQADLISLARPRAGFDSGLTLKFPYEIEVYERPTRLVLVGCTRCFAYREQISFSPQGTGTSIEYRASMTLHAWLALGNPILALIYQRIADDATGGIVPALDASG